MTRRSAICAGISATLLATLLMAPGAAARRGDPAPAPPDLERHRELVTGVPADAPTQEIPALRQSVPALDEARLAARLTSRSDVAGPYLVGAATRADGKALWSARSITPVRPASLMKVVTAHTALKTFGPRHRYLTKVRRDSSSPARVYLQGSGDPTLSSARIRALASATATAQKAKGATRVQVRYDDYLLPLPTNATGWQTDDVPTWVAPVRALVRDSRNVRNTSADAATYFASRLRAHGLTVVDTKRGRTPSGASTLATTSSPQLMVIVQDMLRVSQNDYAEALLWTSGVKAGAPRTWAGVTGHSRRLLARGGVDVSRLDLYDGSGLSRSDRVTAQAMRQLLGAIDRDPALTSVIYNSKGMPIAGRTGTLEDRYRTDPTDCAAVRVRAKTGSLSSTTALAGRATGTDGKTRSFVFIIDGRTGGAATREQVDRLATTVTGCW